MFKIVYLFFFCYSILGFLPTLGETLKGLYDNLKYSIKINSIQRFWDQMSKAVKGKPFNLVVGYYHLGLLVFLIAGPYLFFKQYLTENNDSNADNKFFKSLNNSEIGKHVIFLNQNLPNKPTEKNYQLTFQKVTVNVVENSPLKENLQSVADIMCKHLKMTKPIKVMTLSNIDAGKYESIDGMKCIYVNEGLETQNFEQKVAVLAHEISHYFLDSHHIYFQDMDKNELLTEINAVYVGFGLLLLDGYEVMDNPEVNMASKVGYVNSKIIFDIIVKTAKIRKQNPEWIIKNIRFPYNLMAWYQLRDLLKAYRAHRKRAQKTA